MVVKIGVIGCYGRVNQLIIQEINNNPNCQLTGVLVRNKNIDNPLNLPFYDNINELAHQTDAIIDFTNPASCISIAVQLAKTPKLFVSGTTGFTEEEFKHLENCSQFMPIIWSANMSIGINFLYHILELATDKLNADFDVGIIDIHHRHKKDSPSGTAISLAKIIEAGKNKREKTQISSLRLGGELGSHQIKFSSVDESINFTHQTYDRRSYAKGAIAACLWGHNKSNGFYSMRDVLEL
jgi:4-hydroxy-tetrahydrodipicolinate reductase